VNQSRRPMYVVFSVLAALAIAALACGGGAAPTAIPPTDVPLPTDAPPTKAPIVIDTPTDVPVDIQPTDSTTHAEGDQSYVDDFSSDQGNWEVFNSDFGSSKVDKGVLLLGPFNDCSENGDTPFGCFTQCLWCGTLVNYDISADAAYISGDASSTFGLVLRFQDANGNGLVDPEDYFLDYEISAAEQHFYVYQHLPDGGGWSTLDERQDDTILKDDINTLRAFAHDDGTKIDLYLNGSLIENLDVKAGSAYGTIGLVTGFKGMQAGFDNFNITLQAPATDISGTYNVEGTNPDGSTYTGQAVIASSANGFDINWTFGNGTQVGSGRLSDYVFSARYSTTDSDVVGSATYLLQADGSLKGTWRNDGEEGVGNETLTRAP